MAKVKQTLGVGTSLIGVVGLAAGVYAFLMTPAFIGGAGLILSAGIGLATGVGAAVGVFTLGLAAAAVVGGVSSLLGLMKGGFKTAMSLGAAGAMAGGTIGGVTGLAAGSYASYEWSHQQVKVCTTDFTKASSKFDGLVPKAVKWDKGLVFE